MGGCLFRRKAVWAKRGRVGFNFVEVGFYARAVLDRSWDSMERHGHGSRISDGWMPGAWVLRTGLGSRLEMDF